MINILINLCNISAKQKALKAMLHASSWAFKMSPKVAVQCFQVPEILLHRCDDAVHTYISNLLSALSKLSWVILDLILSYNSKINFIFPFFGILRNGLFFWHWAAPAASVSTCPSSCQSLNFGFHLSSPVLLGQPPKWLFLMTLPHFLSFLELP